MSVNKGDDFEDELDPADSGDFEDDQAVDEDWDDYEDQPEEDNGEGDDEPKPVVKKKSGNFNKILIGAAVLVAGGVIVLQMGKGGPAAPPVAQQEQAAVTAPAAPVPAEPETGLLGSADEMAKIQAEMAKHNASRQQEAPATHAADVVPAQQPVQAVAAVPAPSSEEQPKEVSNIPAPPIPGAAALPVAAATPPALAPAPESIPAPSPHMPNAQDVMLKAPEVKQEPVAVATAPVAVAPDAEISGLNSKIDALITRIGTLEAEVKTLNAKPDQSDQVEALKSSMADLEKKLAERPEKAQSAKVLTAPSEKQEPTEKVSGAEPKVAPKILGASNPSPETTLKKPTTKSSAVKAASNWVLKGAQPGHAIVARAGEDDVRSVSVGDTLPGIGKITAIEYQGGRWAVIGSQARIDQ